MQFGFVTQYSEETVKFAASAGFGCIEAFADRGTALDLNRLDDYGIERIMEFMSGAGLRFGTLSCNAVHLEGDTAKRKENNVYFVRAIKTCGKFGTDIVVTNAFTDRSKTPFENLKVYKEVFGEYAKAAEGEGVRIAVENCPHWVGYPTPVGNIAFSPEMWDAMFGEVPSKAVGLEFDPSHLVWQGIDYLKALVEYGGRVYSFHAKDTEILKDGLYRYGVIGKQIGKESEWDAGWWRYRIPGFGEVNWKGVFNALYEIGYNGPMVIEHEDPVFDGARREEGLRMGLRFLKSLMVG